MFSLLLRAPSCAASATSAVFATSGFRNGCSGCLEGCVSRSAPAAPTAASAHPAPATAAGAASTAGAAATAAATGTAQHLLQLHGDGLPDHLLALGGAEELLHARLHRHLALGRAGHCLQLLDQLLLALRRQQHLLSRQHLDLLGDDLLNLGLHLRALKFLADGIADLFGGRLGLAPATAPAPHGAAAEPQPAGNEEGRRRGPAPGGREAARRGDAPHQDLPVP